MSQQFDNDYERGMRKRRTILGDAWVDRSLEHANSFNADFQNLITRFAWHEIWGRPGLEARARRMIVLAITAALGRWEEFELHVGAALLDASGDGLTLDELKEVLMQSAIYAGVPVANTAFALASKIARANGHVLAPAAPADSIHPGVGREGFTSSAPRLYYTERQPRSGRAARTVVFSHALGLDLSMWDELANLLAQDCRVICYDHRGHGGSDAPPGPYTLAELAGDAERLLAELEAGPVTWIGLSMGGMVGQELALRHPERVAALVIANSSSGYPVEAQAVWRQRIETVQSAGLGAIADAVMERYFHPGFRAAHPATVARFKRRLLATDNAGYVACCQAIAQLNTTGRLAAIEVPVLVIAGALDNGTPVAMSERMVEALPAATLKVLDDASHLSVIEQPAAFAVALEAFLQG